MFRSRTFRNDCCKYEICKKRVFEREETHNGMCFQVEYSEMQSVYSNCTQRATFRMDHRGVNLMFEDPVSFRFEFHLKPSNLRFTFVFI